MRFPSCCMQHNGHTACNTIKKPKNTMHATDSFLVCVAFFLCVHCVRCSFLTCVAWPACVVSFALCMAAWKPTFKSVFIGLHALSSCHIIRNTCNATDARLATQSKKQNTQRMHEKNTMHAHAIDAILACIAWVASVALYTIAWKPNFKSIFCILTAAAMFWRLACVLCRPMSTGNN